MRIAIVKLSAMGDIIHAMVALQFLKAARPKLRIDWIVEESFAPVLEHNPHIDSVMPVHLKRIKRRPSALFSEIGRIRRYARRDYDLVIDAQGLIKSALTARLLGSTVAGFDRHGIREGAASLLYRRRVHIDYAANTIDRNVRVLGEPLGVRITPEMIRSKEPFLFYDRPTVDPGTLFDSGRKKVLFVIGSTWESRNYPKEHFAAVARAMDADILALWGNTRERERAEWIAEHAPNVRVAPRLDLNDLKALIDACDLLIGNDTGPTHMAWGLNRPSITLFGPTPVSRIYITPINRALKSPSPVDPRKLDRNDFSIARIPPEAVTELARRLLAGELLL